MLNLDNYLGFIQIYATETDWEPASSAEGAAFKRDNPDARLYTWTIEGYKCDGDII